MFEKWRFKSKGIKDWTNDMLNDIRNGTDPEKPAIIEAASDGNTTLVQSLLNSGAKVNARFYYTGGTALMEAARNGHAEVVKILLNAGAKVNMKSYLDLTASSRVLSWRKIPTRFSSCPKSFQQQNCPNNYLSDSCY
ncbi:hypothetical protein ES708_29404 [subsurface metagenome]